MFYRDVDLADRAAMTVFLEGHFRYSTMNSWNGNTSYANNVKIAHLDIPRELQDTAYDLLGAEGGMDCVNEVLREWDYVHDMEYQAGFNGRSGGYIVMYRGGRDYEHASTTRCDCCFKKTYHKVDTPCTSSGCPGTLRVLAKPLPRVYTSGKGIDQDVDFESWAIESLVERVKLVQSFDQMCDDAVAMFIDCCRTYEVVDEQILVPKTVRVLKERVCAN